MSQNIGSRIPRVGWSALERLVSHAAAWWLIALGPIARIAGCLDNRSLWGDEAALAVNLVELPAGKLLGPPYFQQSAPVGFLLLEKGVWIIMLYHPDWRSGNVEKTILDVMEKMRGRCCGSKGRRPSPFSIRRREG